STGCCSGSWARSSRASWSPACSRASSARSSTASCPGRWLLCCSGSVLKEKLLDPASGVLLYGTTPPRTGTAEDAVRAAADKLAARLASLPLDGVVVYDIQDESGRTAVPRPFAFTGTIDPRAYARLLAERTGRPSIAYKSLGAMDEPGWQAWLDESARDFGVGFLSVVGRPTSGVKYPLALSKAIRLAAAHRSGFAVGGVAIAERHTAERS